MLFHGVSWFLFLKHLLKFHVISMISWNVFMSLHLGLLYWNVTTILERILVRRFMVQCCGNGSWCGCIARRIWNNDRWYPKNWLIGGKYLSEAIGTILWYIIYMVPWVIRWKSLKPSRKTLRCGCMELVLPLGFSP